MVKKLLIMLGLAFGIFALGIAFLLLGMTIGGNYFVDFEFLGGRGYEATGTLGFMIGIVLGVILSVIIIVKTFRK